MAGIYDNMKFDPYEFREYPKWVGATMVNDEAEEATALGGDPVVREADEKARLVKVAAVFSVQVDKRWNADRMRKAIADAGFDPEHDPEA